MFHVAGVGGWWCALSPLTPSTSQVTTRMVCCKFSRKEYPGRRDTWLIFTTINSRGWRYCQDSASPSRAGLTLHYIQKCKYNVKFSELIFVSTFSTNVQTNTAPRIMFEGQDHTRRLTLAFNSLTFSYLCHRDATKVKGHISVSADTCQFPNLAK